MILQNYKVLAPSVSRFYKAYAILPSLLLLSVRFIEITEPDSAVSVFKASSATLLKYTGSVPSPET